MNTYNKPRLTIVYPNCKNVHLVKDQGMIPYVLSKHLGYKAKLVCYKNDEYNYLEYEVKGLEIEFIKNIHGPEKDGISYLEKNSNDIDILYVWGIYQDTLQWIKTYKKINPNGMVYLKLDANVWWMNRIELNNEMLEILKGCKVISVECKKLHEYLNQKWPLKIEYIPNGYYNFYNSKRVTYDEKENTILTVGRIGTSQKANHILLEAFKKVENLIPNWKVKLIGDIEEGFKPYLKQYFNDNKELKDRIEFMGGISNRKLLESEYRKAKIFCLTSTFEGFPLVFPEAAANGCFIISSDIDPAYDITDNEGYGRIFPLNDVNQLSEILLNTARDEEMLNDISKNIQDYTTTNFDWIKLCRKLDALLYL